MRVVIDQIRLTWALLTDRRTPLLAKAAILLPIVYFFSPIDLIPDVILGLGQLDDLGVLLAGMRLMETLTPAYLVEEHRARLQGHNKPSGDVIDMTNKAKRNL